MTGVDSEARDGLSWETTWSSLAYASDCVPQGENMVQLGSGTFVAAETAQPKSGFTIAGVGQARGNSTQIIASPDWPLSETPCNGNSVLNEYLIVIQNAQDITVRDVLLASEPEHRITGAIMGTSIN